MCAAGLEHPNRLRRPVALIGGPFTCWSCCASIYSEALEQFGWVDAKAARKVDQHSQRRIPFAALEIAQISNVHAGAVREVLLSKPLGFPKVVQDPAELFP